MTNPEFETFLAAIESGDDESTENAVQALRERIVTPEDREQQYLP